MPATAQRIAYQPTDPGETIALGAAPYIVYAVPDASEAITWRGQPASPRLIYAALPADERVAPTMLFDVVGSEDEGPGTPVAQDYAPHPAIWRIGDKDTTIWLFGTVHVLPPGFVWRDARIDSVAKRARALIVESIDSSAPASFRPEKEAKLPPLVERASADHRDALRAQQAKMPAPAVALMDRMPTWMAAIAIGFTREVHAGQASAAGADDDLETRFRKAGKPVTAIEDGAAVMKALNATPEAQQREMLDQAIDAETQSDDARFAAVHAWAKGDLAALATELGRTADPLSKPLMHDRNRAWAAALATRLRRPGRVLFAAGAAHFVGPGSVIALLQKRGIRVVRLP
ncbi:TraB/GumN family protein [Sphingomonas immobilis]|uniref:TraB/GumN family protein n=1 Tax=Sphingomonas immobilis TaxID=3063997 RepID=A0ABT8ZY94_9SPHN|nr:TraB/GumN family protein [Sphingomonas sp. CA1-15]MDO7842548.1 TraB/GumN family protein [Sphingomonas sp. CA1-15]